MHKTGKPHVLLISTAYGIGGTERSVLSIALGLQQLDVAVQTVFPQVDAEMGALSLARQLGVSVQSDRAVRDLSVRRDYRHLLALRKFVRSTRAQVVNIHFGINFISIWDVLAIRLAGVKRCIASVHHAIPFANQSTQIMTRLASYLCDRVVVTTPAMTQILTDGGVAHRKIVEIPLGLKPPTQRPTRAEARTMLGLPQEALIISSLGRLVPEKGFLDLITGVSLVGNYPQPIHLVIGGDGPSRKIFEALGKACLHERVRFLGRIPEPELLYAASDIFALPSHEEGFGLVFIEAAFHGVPSVGADVGGVRYAIVHNETGLLVPVRTPSALTSALQRLLGDEALRKQLGTAAQQRALRQFSDQRMAEQYKQVLFAPA